jgi:hypothetical protein
MNHNLAINVLAIRTAITNAYREASQMPEGPERTEALVMFQAMDDQSQEAVRAFKVACPSALSGVGL